MSTSIRIVIVDPQAVVRESLNRTLSAEAGFEVVGDYGTVAAAIEALSVNTVDIVLLELALSDERGGALLTWARKRASQVRFLVFTGKVTNNEAVWLMRQGVSGIFLKDKSVADLISAIKVVAQGGKYLDPSCVALLMTVLTGSGPVPTGLNFTDEEQSVLQDLIEGSTNKEIGAHLGISEAAVKSAVQRLFQKAGVRSRGRLIRFALENHKAKD